MITKFAKAEILDVRTSSSRDAEASLNKFASIGEGDIDYRLEDGYIYTKVRAISSRVNKNNDGWPSEELAKAYSTFIGKPIFVDHNNSDPGRARGVVVDARLHVEEDLQKASALDSYYASAPDNHKPPTWIELLLETDAREFPKLARAIVAGDIDSVSMGANVERTQCNICNNWATNVQEYCDHIRSKGATFDFESNSGHKTSKRSYEDCYDIHFFEISYVFDPADVTALVLDKISNTKTADLPQVDLAKVPDRVNTLRQEKPCPQCGNEMEDGKCEVCGYDQPEDVNLNDDLPPESLGDPDIEAAKSNLSQIGPEPDVVPGPNYGETIPNAPGGLPSPVQKGPGMGANPLRNEPGGLSFSTVKPDTAKVLSNEWEIVKDAGLLTRVEKPILPPNRITNDKVVNPKTVQNPQKPVESNTKDNQNMSNENKLDQALSNLEEYLASKTAGEPTWSDGHTDHQEPDMAVDAGPAPATMTFPDKGQEDPVTSEVGSAGQGPIGVAASTEHEAGEMPDFIKEKMEKKDDSEDEEKKDDSEDKDEDDKDAKKEAAADSEDDKDEEKEEDDKDEDKEDKTSAAKSDDDKEDDEDEEEEKEEKEEKPSKKMAKALGVKRNEVLAMLDAAGTDLVLDVVEEMILNKKAVKKARKQARKQAAEYFNAENTALQVDVAAPLREEVGEGTKTFPSDPMHVGDPITNDNANELGGPIGTAFASEDDVRSHIFRSLKIAETEIELGLISEGDKFERAASLEKESSQELDAREETLVRVRDNNTRTASKKVAGRVPSLKTANFMTHSSTDVSAAETEDASLFM